MKYVLFVLEERVKDLIETRLHDIRGDETAHKMRLRRLPPRRFVPVPTKCCAPATTSRCVPSC